MGEKKKDKKNVKKNDVARKLSPFQAALGEAVIRTSPNAAYIDWITGSQVLQALIQLQEE